MKRCPWGLVWDYVLRQCAYPSVDTRPAVNSIHINENQVRERGGGREGHTGREGGEGGKRGEKGRTEREG